MPFITLLPVFAGEVLNAGAKGFGFLVGATGAGALAAALLLAFRGDIRDKGRFISDCSAERFGFPPCILAVKKYIHIDTISPGRRLGAGKFSGHCQQLYTAVRAR